MNTHFRIAHLSDLHLTEKDSDRRLEPKLPGNRLQGMNKSFAELLNSDKIRNSDIILVTGDVTDKGELPAWKNFDRILREAGVRSRTHIVIGNHDICGVDAFFRLSDRRRLRAFDVSRLKRSLSEIGFRHDYPWVEILREDIALFGIDSNNAGNAGSHDNAIGRIGKFQLEALARLLRKHRDIPIKIVALHHSPNMPERATQVRRKGTADPEWVRYTHEIPQEDRWALRYMALSHGVRLMVHGHLHEDEDRRVNGIRIIGALSSTQPVTEGARSFFQFNRYDVVKTDANSYRINREVCRVNLT